MLKCLPTPICMSPITAPPTIGSKCRGPRAITFQSPHSAHSDTVSSHDVLSVQIIKPLQASKGCTCALVAAAAVNSLLCYELRENSPVRQLWIMILPSVVCIPRPGRVASQTYTIAKMSFSLIGLLGQYRLQQNLPYLSYARRKRAIMQNFLVTKGLIEYAESL